MPSARNGVGNTAGNQARPTLHVSSQVSSSLYFPTQYRHHHSMNIESLAKEVARLSAALQQLQNHQETSDVISRYRWLHDKLMVGPKPTVAQ